MIHPELKQARRWAKKKEMPYRTGPETSALFAGGSTDKPGNGAVYWCQSRECRIDTAVCIVHQTREPRKCQGCNFRR